MNDSRLRESVRNRVRANVAGIRGASCGDLCFVKVAARHTSGILSIEFKCLSKRNAKAFEQLFAGRLLTIDSRHFLDPADPPFAVLLHDRGIVIRHAESISVFGDHDPNYHEP